jgi:hypothetical protein
MFTPLCRCHSVRWAGRVLHGRSSRGWNSWHRGSIFVTEDKSSLLRVFGFAPTETVTMRTNTSRTWPTLT